MKKTLLKTLYKTRAFAPFHWANRNKVLILTYHRFASQQEAGKVSADEFREHLKYLRSYTRVLPIAEAVSCLNQGKSLPRNTTVITIDDGYDDAYEIAFPILREFGMPATVYVITDFLDHKIWLWTDIMRYVLLHTKKNSITIDFTMGDVLRLRFSSEYERLSGASRINDRLKKLPNDLKDQKIFEIAKALEIEIPTLPPEAFAPLDWEQCQEMEENNVRIESHSVTHPILTKIGDDELAYELRTSKKRLEDILGRRVDHFCYPNGTLDKNVRSAARDAGYVSAVTTAYGFNDLHTNPLSMNRIDALPSIASFAQSASGFEAARIRRPSNLTELN